MFDEIITLVEEDFFDVVSESEHTVEDFIEMNPEFNEIIMREIWDLYD